MAQRKFKYRILVVDDDEALLVTTTALLSDAGYVVETAKDGFEALALLREMMPEVLVSDLKMPNMSGFELLAVVRKRFPGIAVVATSGEFAPLGIAEGIIADKYVAKGENANFELVEAVRELLSASPLRSQPAKPSTAPAWLPRSAKGYLVVTCLECLRSFSRLRKHLEIGTLIEDECLHCGASVRYHIDATTSADSKDSATETLESSRRRVDASKRAIADSQTAIADSKKRL